MAKAGRKPKLTLELVGRVKPYASLGLYNRTICGILNICERSWYEWLEKGEADIKHDKDTVYAQFVQILKKGESEFEARMFSKIQQAVDNGDWQAGAWVLERKFKKREENYNKMEKQQVEHSGRDGQAIEVKSSVNFDKLSVEDLDTLETIITSVTQ